MNEWYSEVAKAGNKTAEAILQKVKKGEWFFLEDEGIERCGNSFIHKYGFISWMSKAPYPTPFVANVTEVDTILKPAFDANGKYDIYGVDTHGFCKMKTSEDKDCLIVETNFFLYGLSLKDIDRYF